VTKKRSIAKTRRHAASEVQGALLRLESNLPSGLHSTPESLTAEGGAVLLREVGERLGLWKLLEKGLSDPRDPDLITHPFGEVLRTAMLPVALGLSRHGDDRYGQSVMGRRCQGGMWGRVVAWGKNQGRRGSSEARGGRGEGAGGRPERPRCSRAAWAGGGSRRRGCRDEGDRE